jgi:hypothetical protein
MSLAKCSACGRRERVLPCDAMPGKRFGIEVTFAAVGKIITDGTGRCGSVRAAPAPTGADRPPGPMMGHIFH